MYFWNTNALADELKSGELSQHERFKYFFLYTVTYVFIFEYESYDESQLITSFDYLITLFSILFTIVGLIISYRENRKGDDKEFIERYICISLPISIRIVALLVCMMMLYVLSCDYLGLCIYEDTSEDFSYFTLTAILIVSIIYWWRIVHHIRYISGSEKDQKTDVKL